MQVLLNAQARGFQDLVPCGDHWVVYSVLHMLIIDCAQKLPEKAVSVTTGECWTGPTCHDCEKIALNGPM